MFSGRLYPSREPFKVHPAIAVTIIVFCLALIVWLIVWKYWQIHLLVFEIIALVALALAFRHWPPMIRWLGTMPVPHRVVFALIFAAMLAGHFSLDSKKYFPFVSWEIFANTREIDPVPCTQFIATTESGTKKRLLVEQLFPSIVQFYPPADADSAAMTKLVFALARAYDGKHPDDPARSVDLMLVSVKLHGVEPPSWQPLKHYDVSSAHSN